MAWLALAAGLGFPLLILGTESSELGNIAYPFYIFVGSVVGAYVGFATMEDINHDRIKGSHGRNPRSPNGRGGMANKRVEASEPDRWHGGKAY